MSALTPTLLASVSGQLIVDEGVKLKPYYCTEGKLTIGVGRNLEGNGLSWWEMVALIGQNPERKARFPRDYETLDGETLLMALIRDMKINGITKDEAIMLMNNDIYQADADLRRTIRWYEGAPEALKEVLINMCFNMGIRTLTKFRNTLWYMGAGEYEQAAKNMIKSKWARQVKDRATRLAERVRALA